MVVRNVITMDKIDDPKVLCKAITSIRNYFGNAAMTKKQIIYVLIKSIKLKKPTPGKSREYLPVPITTEQAGSMFNIMIERAYMEYVFSYKPRPGEKARNPIGEKMYRIGELRLTECMESSWYKNRMRKERFIKKEEHIDARSCAALQQIFALFGTTPFSYNTATRTAKSISQLSEDTKEFNAAEIMSLKVMRRNLYGHDAGNFREVWQKLIRSGYIVLHKVKTADGYIKSTGLYRINTPYLKHCLAGMI